MSESPLEPADVLRAFEAETRVETPPALAPVGCLMMTAAVTVTISLVMLSRLGGFVPPAWFYGLAGALLLGGAMIFLIFRRRAAAFIVRRAEEALARLAGGERSVEAAVSLLAAAGNSAGPVRLPAIDVQSVAHRLGEALPFVLQVERVLIAAGRIYPVFTGGDPERR